MQAKIDNFTKKFEISEFHQVFWQVEEGNGISSIRKVSRPYKQNV